MHQVDQTPVNIIGSPTKETVGYIPGVWDLLHVGHVNILTRASMLVSRLVVGVASDQVVIADKGEAPVIEHSQRVIMVAALRCVYWALVYYSLEFITHLNLVKPDMLIVGGDWGSAVRHKEAEQWVVDNKAQLVRLPYTKGISTTIIKERISHVR